MEHLLALTVGILFSGALFLMLSGELVRFVFGFVLMGNAVNLLIFAAGRLSFVAPPLIGKTGTAPAGPVANALPQALILTAIVISFAMTLFLLILLYRTYAQTRTLNTRQADFLSESAGDDTGSDTPEKDHS
ncbi:NADH-quinone oxidoreductase subunit K [Desulfotignum balticum]|jgi:multisubunit Na+/H+ antiporter MnhC subunit|uniref:NADH-quinone oxidoreductase subunit K n=1 Tax=Desulfotignum balticum TaxID=115781 RepID=A0A931CT83_9BACT|nr:NADH-quinone oxidoreductase subunit K [Desulfotignum balticum]MBG0778625.1 NADH-quinone oxidoreductase subunit K [Desulfotignum balticum]